MALTKIIRSKRAYKIQQKCDFKRLKKYHLVRCIEDTARYTGTAKNNTTVLFASVDCKTKNHSGVTEVDTNCTMLTYLLK